MVFHYALFPHLDVAGNVGYGLGRKPDRGRIAEVLELVGLAGDAQARTRAVGRPAAARRPRQGARPHPGSHPARRAVLEPRRGLRDRLRQEVREIPTEARVTTLFVTHDQAEALSIAESIAVMREGRIEQTGTGGDLLASGIALGGGFSARSRSCPARRRTGA